MAWRASLVGRWGTAGSFMWLPGCCRLQSGAREGSRRQMLEACLFLGPFSCRLSWLYGFRRIADRASHPGHSPHWHVWRAGLRGDGIRPFAMTGDGHWLAASRYRWTAAGRPFQDYSGDCRLAGGNRIGSDTARPSLLDWAVDTGYLDGWRPVFEFY